MSTEVSDKRTASTTLATPIKRNVWTQRAVWAVFALLLIAFPFITDTKDNRLWLIIATQGAILAIGAFVLNVLI